MPANTAEDIGKLQLISRSPSQTVLQPRRWSARTLFSAVIFIIVGYLFVMQYLMNGYEGWKLSPKISLRNKVILLWTPFFSEKDYGFGVGIREPFIRAGCPIDACELTINKSRFFDADAIVFHMRSTEATDLPSTKRLPHQRFVFFLLESPDNTNQDLSQYNGFFNWTMTYRRDSDIVVSYFSVNPIDEPKLPMTTPSSTKKFSSLKQSLVSWLASNCQTDGRRERYVRELSRHIKVDVFGRCGKPCPNGKLRHKCHRLVFDEHKFYLSFENSVCRDYVTEKLSNALQNNIVPIVYGGADYVPITPPHSYIDVRDFKSPAQLASHLIALDLNDTAYNEYLSWKSHFTVTSDNWISEGICDLCAKLHRETPPIIKVYQNIQQWWEVNGNCSHEGLTN